MIFWQPADPWRNWPSPYVRFPDSTGFTAVPYTCWRGYRDWKLVELLTVG